MIASSELIKMFGVPGAVLPQSMPETPAASSSDGFPGGGDVGGGECNPVWPTQGSTANPFPRRAFDVYAPYPESDRYLLGRVGAPGYRPTIPPLWKMEQPVLTGLGDPVDVDLEGFKLPITISGNVILNYFRRNGVQSAKVLLDESDPDADWTMKIATLLPDVKLEQHVDGAIMSGLLRSDGVSTEYSRDKTKDGTEIGETKNKLKINGWEYKKIAGTLADRLQESESGYVPDDDSDAVVVRRGRGGELAYFAIGKNLKPAKNGKLTLKDDSSFVLGSFTANQSSSVSVTIPKPKNGKLTLKDGSGSVLGSFTANQSTDVSVSIPKPKNGKLTLKDGSGSVLGSFTANQSSSVSVTIPKPKNGKLLVQFGTDAATDKFSADQSADSTIQFAKVAETGSYKDLVDKPTIPSGTLKYIGEDGVRYDISTQQLQIRVDTLNFATGATTQGTWKMITGGQAVPHSIGG